jgi:hypothetical protein
VRPPAVHSVTRTVRILATLSTAGTELGEEILMTRDLIGSWRHSITKREFRLPNVPFRQLAPYSPMKSSISPKWTIFVCQVAISGSGLVCVLARQGYAETQPQRDARRLHGLPHNRYQLGIQAVQVCLLSQPGGECFECLPGVVLAAVEAAVYERLDTPPQGVNRAAMARIEMTTASWGCCSWPVRARKIASVVAAPEVHERQHGGKSSVPEYFPLGLEEAVDVRLGFVLYFSGQRSV